MHTQTNHVETPEVFRPHTAIEDARDGLGFYVSEQDRRRQTALNLKRQIKEHKALAFGVGVVAVAATAGAVAMIVRSRRSTGQPLPWSSIAPAVSQKSRRFAGFLLGTVVPVALKAARGVIDRAASRQPRLAKDLQAV